MELKIKNSPQIKKKLNAVQIETTSMQVNFHICLMLLLWLFWGYDKFVRKFTTKTHHTAAHHHESYTAQCSTANTV